MTHLSSNSAAARDADSSFASEGSLHMIIKRSVSMGSDLMCSVVKLRSEHK